ncbi:phosphatase PAP2 family protein [Catalinimonas sp. 4WD22]|uniref:phosphatase PAP2 family protein n=1 Tax=Catalinimonas locisalis TaxID=3133978 RepID=UPI00310105D6
MALEEQLRTGIRYIRTYLKKYLNNDNEYLPYIISLAVGLILAVLTLNGFIEILEELKDDGLTGFDDTVAEYVQSYRSSSLTPFFGALTEIGDRYGYLTLVILLAGFFYFRYKNWKFSLQVTVVLALSSLVNLVLKRWINRQRPSGEHMVEVFTLSFPSGHAMSAMAFYGFLVYLTWRYARHLGLKVALTLLWIFMILGIGISRIYLGVHYPSDIIAGYLGGLCWVAFCIVVFNVLSIMRKRKKARHELAE